MDNMEIPNNITGLWPNKITISGIELIEDDPFADNTVKEVVKIPDWLFKFITREISNAYTEGEQAKLKQIKKLLEIDG